MRELILKPATENDYEDYYMVRSCPGDIYWNGYDGKPDKEKFKTGYLKRLGDTPLTMPEDRRNYLIQLINIDSKVSTIGFIQLIRRVDGIDIGYTVMEEYQGHGYATRALLLGIEKAREFDDRIYVQIRDDNEASKRVAIKCGFMKSDDYIVKSYSRCGNVKLRKYYLVSTAQAATFAVQGKI